MIRGFARRVVLVAAAVLGSLLGLVAACAISAMAMIFLVYGLARVVFQLLALIWNAVRPGGKVGPGNE